MSADQAGRTAAAPEAEPFLADRYLLEERLGMGGAGTVWRARDTVLGRAVAIKLLHPALAADPVTVARFRREAVAAASVTHPNAVTLYDIRQDGGQVYLVMELVEGPDLAEVLRRHGPLDPAAAATAGHQVAAALGAAHRRGLVHRDVKPANVLLAPHGTAKVADFGIATALGDAQARLTTPGMVLGTAAYLAPEQLRGTTVDARADVYALGLVLHEAVTGAVTFVGDTATAVAAARLEADVPPPGRLRPDLPGALDAVIVRATRRDPGERFRDGAAMAAALAGCLTPSGASTLAALAGGAGGPTGARVRAPREEAAPTAEHPAGAPDAPLGTEAVATARHPAASPRRSAPRPADTSAVEASPSGRGARAGSDGRPHVRALVAAGALVLAALAVSLLLGPATPRDQPAAPDPPAVAPAAPLPVVSATDFDPFGDGSEHPEDVPAAHDGDPETAWTTERYTRPDLGGLKPGVGLWFDLGAPRPVGVVEIDVVTPGIDLEVYALDTAPAAAGPPRAWGDPVTRVRDAPAAVRTQLQAGARARYWLVWITDLAGDAGGYRAAVSAVRFVPS